MKPTAYLVYISRRPIVDKADLYDVLDRKVIAGAALDVREEELPNASPLNGLTNILLAPYVAPLTVEAQDRVQESLSEDVDRILSDKPALHFANFAMPRRSGQAGAND
jgi:D-3-phosphoglycerate dehydrogenase / 2-oxoglutarate reductase